MNYHYTRYNNLSFRISLAFLASSFILLYGENLNLFNVIRDWDFYRSLGGCFLITFLLIDIIHFLTILLDKWAPWDDNKLYRALLQVTLCWVLPCLISYFMAILYFKTMGIDIDKTDYELMEFPLINILFLFLNYYYYKKYESIKDKFQLAALSALVKTSNVDEDRTGTMPPLILRYNGNITQLNVCRDISCFYKAKDGYWIKPLDGNSIMLNQSLTQIEETYGGHSFFRLNRALIINRKAIKNYSADEQTGSIHVEMFNEEGRLEHHSNDNLFEVSSKHAQEFIDWFNGER